MVPRKCEGTFNLFLKYVMQYYTFSVLASKLAHRMYLILILLLRLIHTDDRLCGLVVRVSVYRSRGPVSIPCTTRFSEKWVWKGVHSGS
jgi:hypothetical protein